MHKIIDLLNKTQFGSLATIENNEPRVRPFQFQFAEKGCFYFCSLSSKKVVKQLEENQMAEFSAFDRTFHFIRIRGKVKFTNDQRIRNKVLKLNPYFKDKIRLSQQDEVIVFYVEHGEACYGYYDEYPTESIKF